MNEINTTFLRLAKRAETVSNEYLFRTFVNVGPLITILSNKDHEILYGRRGTGKTHALNFLKNNVLEKSDIPVYIDLRTIGSNGGIFSDSNLSLKERATRLLIDTISLILNEIVDFTIDDDMGRFDLSKITIISDKVWSSITQIKIDSEIEKSETKEDNTSDTSTVESALKLSTKSLELSVGDKSEVSNKEKISTTIKTTGKQEYRVHFSSVFSTLQELTRELKINIWIIFDEWAEIPQDLQPYLSEMLRRTMLPNNSFIVKIGAIEQRTKMSLIDSVSNRIGIEIGADIAATQNLDEYMVFDNDEEKSIEFFKQLIFLHFSNIADQNLILENFLSDSDRLLTASFTQINAFQEFVRASEGIPRDAINIIAIAAQKADENKISVDNIRTAARIWYSRGKEKAISANENASKLLRWIIDEVIGKRTARAFLLEVNHNDILIDYLFDSRILHIIKENVSGKDIPGKRYNVYSIDYGCYVDLINTSLSPKGLFEAKVDSDDEIYVDVPKNDYRSIRRAILNLEEFYQTIT